MTCKELTDFLDDYLAGDLRPDERGRFEAHLGDCPSCVAYLRSYRETIGLVRQVAGDSDAEAAADVPPELVRAILAARRR
jgi:anti-sigma factor RsiW